MKNDITPFNKEYAQIYDTLYSEKDYQGEVDLIERIIDEYKPGAKNILDYGCGTGNHARILAKRGYNVFCLDPNENMLKIARQKLKGYKNVKILNTKTREKIGEGSVDVCITLFDVVSYMNTDKELNSFLSYVKKILVKGGLLVFDFWYGPGVINLKPEKKWKEYKVRSKNILRLTTPVHDKKNHIVKACHEVIIWSGSKMLSRFREEHSMRYFFDSEIRKFLRRYGFKILKFGTWKNLTIRPTSNDWSALVVCSL